MSHVDMVELEVKSLSALRDACVALGLTFCEGQRTYEWYGRSVGDYPMPAGMTKAELGKCAHAIKVPGASYEIGVVQRDGHYILVYDFWGTTQGEPIVQQLGKGLEKLKVSYSQKLAYELAKRHRLKVSETRLPDGRLRLRLTT